jgi:hypothetical protein
MAAVATSPDKKLRVAVAYDLKLGDHARAAFRANVSVLELALG